MHMARSICRLTMNFLKLCANRTHKYKPSFVLILVSLV